MSRSGEDTLLVFDLDTNGHHAGYILHLVRTFGVERPEGRMVVASVQAMVADHADLAAAIESTPGVSFLAVSPRRPSRVPGPLQLPVKALCEWEALVRACRDVRATHAMVMYADALLQVPLALGLRAPCPISGIYFRPIFHYDTVSPLPLTPDERRRGRRQRRLLSRALRHPDLATLFTLDPFVVPELNALTPQDRATWLPDPVDTPAASARATRRAELGVSEGETMLLLFGVLSSRKGVREVLDAMRLLPADVRRSTVLWLVGPVQPSSARDIEEARAALGSRLRVRDEFVAEADVQSYFDAADVVLAPYPRHVGMSAVVVRAAAAGRPVVASAFGLMGALIRDRRLGVGVDAREPAALCEAILDAVGQPDTVASAAELQRLARSHRPERFARAILQHTMTVRVRAQELATPPSYRLNTASK